MADVAIVGAGALGGALADALAHADATHTVHLIDDDRDVAAGKALDLMQARPIVGFTTRISAGADLLQTAGRSIVAIADRPASGEWHLDEALALVRRLRQVANDSIIVCAGSTARELVERSVRELGVPRLQIAGSAPEALRGAARAMVALAAHTSPADVQLQLLGVPPDHIVIPWDAATVGGLAAIHVLGPQTLRRLSDRLRALWPPGPLALAAAASAVISSMLGRSRRGASAFVAPDDAYGRRARAVALPVRLGAAGIAAVETPTLTARDQLALENAMLL